MLLQWFLSKTLLLPPAGFEYYEASAKENINVRQVFERLVDIICVKMSERVDVEAPAAPGSKTTRLTDKPAQLPQKCCWSSVIPQALKIRKRKKNI